MNKPPLASLILLAAFGAMSAGPVFADPGPRAVKPKPKLTPRGLPGMSAGPLPTVAQSEPQPAPAAHAARTPARAPGTVATSGGPVPGGQARILMVFRSGAEGVPPVGTPATVPAAMAEPPLVRPASLTDPREGQVRIISKAEAEALVAKPKE